MKADTCGTYTEQIRARMGWISPKQRRELNVPLDRICSSCQYFWLKRIVMADERVNFSPYCRHPMAGGKEGHATRESSLCSYREEKKEVQTGRAMR